MPEKASVILASNNPHKLKEMARLLPELRMQTPAAVGVAFDHEETGASFLENALGKAQALYRLISRPVLADDSGLSVLALGGEPGCLHSFTVDSYLRLSFAVENLKVGW